MKSFLLPEYLSEQEKKKQLLKEIDIAIKDTVYNKVDFKDETHTPKPFIASSRGYNTYEGEEYSEQLKKYKKNKEKYDTITFKIGNCVYTILNIKENLEQFKKAIIDKFSITVTKTGKKTFKKRIMNPTNKRVKVGEDVAYYQKFRPRKQKIISGERNFYSLGYFTDGQYMVKTEKPVGIKFNDIGSSKIKDLLSNYEKAIPAKIVAEFTSFFEYLPVCIHIITEDNKHFALNANFVDIILTKHPTAKIYTISETGMTFFIIPYTNKIKYEVVGLVMPLKLSSYNCDIDIEYKLGTLESLGEFATTEYKAMQLKKDNIIDKLRKFI